VQDLHLRPLESPGATLVVTNDCWNPTVLPPTAEPARSTNGSAKGPLSVLRGCSCRLRTSVKPGRSPQPQLAGGAPVEEVGADIDAVGTLGSCGEAEQLAQGQVVEQPSVRWRLGVVELVDDHDVVGVGRNVCDAL